MILSLSQYNFYYYNSSPYTADLWCFALKLTKAEVEGVNLIERFDFPLKLKETILQKRRWINYMHIFFKLGVVFLLCHHMFIFWGVQFI